MKKLFFCVVVLFLISCKRERSNTFSLKDYSTNDTLIFKYIGFNYNLELSLVGNENFAYKYDIRGCAGGGEFAKVTGKYLQNNNRLTLLPDSVFFSILPFNSHYNPKRYKLKYGIDSLKIKTKYDIITWGQSLYLISPEKDIDYRTHPVLTLIDFDIDSVVNNRNDYHDFADYYNLGIEPEEHGRYLSLILDSLEKRLTSEFELNQIPIEWRYLFLKVPVEAKIINVKSENRECEDSSYQIYKVILNKGKRDNLRIGIELFDRNMARNIKIVEVESDKCTGVTHDEFLLNETVKTRWE